MQKSLTEQELRQIPLTAIFAAFAIILPQFFHLLGLGPMFLPMFLPVVLGSMLLTWRFALAMAVISPLVSWLFTNMPPLVPPILPVVLSELIVLALVISFIRVHLQKPIWLALVLGLATDRILLFLIVSILAPLFGLNHPLFSWALVMSGIPGIVLQLITVPLAMQIIAQKFPSYLNLADKTN